MRIVYDIWGRRVVEAGRYRLWWDGRQWWRPYSYRAHGLRCIGWLGLRIMAFGSARGEGA